MVDNPPNKAQGIRISVVETPHTTSSCKKIDDKEKQKCGNNSQPYVVMFVAEVIGTGMLMFLGCMGCINTYTNEPTPTHHMGGLAFGLTVMLIIQTVGHISGAHLNPAVTIATVICGILKPIMGVVYIVGQFVGATLGYGLLKVLGSDTYVPDGFCSTNLDPHITPLQGVAIEIVITTILILVCCAVWDKRNAHNTDSTALRFGFTITAISMGAGPLTGASMNTVRSFAPLVFGGSWENQWIYWVGPNVAALIGCAIYKFVFAENEQTSSKVENIYLEEVPQNADKI